MQPFYTVAENAVIFKKLSTDHLYSFDAPSLTKPPVVISAHASVKRVLQETKNFKVPRTKYFPTYLPEDPVVHAKQRGMIGTALHSGAGIQNFGDYAKQITFSLLEERRIVNPGQGYVVDIVKEYARPASFMGHSNYLPQHRQHCRTPFRSRSLLLAAQV